MQCPVSGLSITQGKKCRKEVRKDNRKQGTWLGRKKHPAPELQLASEGSQGGTETAEPCYTLVRWHGTVPSHCLAPHLTASAAAILAPRIRAAGRSKGATVGADPSGAHAARGPPGSSLGPCSQLCVCHSQLQGQRCMARGSPPCRCLSFPISLPLLGLWGRLGAWTAMPAKKTTGHVARAGQGQVRSPGTGGSFPCRCC